MIYKGEGKIRQTFTVSTSRYLVMIYKGEVNRRLAFNVSASMVLVDDLQRRRKKKTSVHRIYF